MRRQFKLYPEQDMIPSLHEANTISRNILDIYLLSDDDQIKLWCRLAIQMAKRMENAVAVYKDIAETRNYILNEEQIKLLEEYKLQERIKPYPTSRMRQRRRLSKILNLCAILRSIYTESSNSDIKYLCRIATRRAKNIAVSLHVYNEAMRDLQIDTNIRKL